MVVILTLPCDSSMEYFPDNTIARYRVHLPVEYNFEGNYEVGLIQFQYTRSWYNVPPNETAMECVILGDNETVTHRIPFTIEAGQYRSTADLLTHINEQLTTAVETVLDESVVGKIRLFSYNQTSRRVTLGKSKDKYLTLQVGGTPELMLRLGFVKPGSNPNESFLYVVDGDEGQLPADLDGSFKNIYVNSDIIAPSHCVGHTLQPLLRSVPIKGHLGRMQLYEPVHIHYLPLRFNRFRQVEIILTTDMGNLVQFERGKTSVTLHIRRARLID